MLDSCFVQLKFDYAATKNLDVDDIVATKDFSAGGYLWKVCCHPDDEDDEGEYLSIYLELVSKSKSIMAILEAFLIGRDGEPSSSHAERLIKAYPIEGFDSWGWPQFVKRSDLEPLYVVDGCVTIVFGVIVVRDDRPLAVPPSDIGDNLGQLLNTADGFDVSFVVGGKNFAAHRAVLAARSPVFKAELFGSMSEATMSCIKLQNIHPATFEVLLRFMYTDVLPDDDELGDDDDSPMEMYQHLLAAADRYAMDRLKMMCANKLWEYVSVDTVTAVLACAMTYNSVELKTKCIAFFANEKNFKTAVLTYGYLKLVQKFPSILLELRAKVVAAP